MSEFEFVCEVTADERRRLPLGRAAVQPNDRFLVAVSRDGEILLTPVVTMPTSVVRRLALEKGMTVDRLVSGEWPEGRGT